ncbi:DUF4309 domain-containing protein [Shimazuella sp. AN120528]|uniref:DUF4309 domain-containing protein n=1 Tax=Shimazuella soli TaxID=1892854 RepID=UPI001F0EC8AA|nr:DUF4309 domain-containing protein [Shimazuella soli]MCH5585110.1 DUF4309 domain-containing protein [Shimazuella soli]
MKKITMAFLSAIVALIVILTGCSQSGADSNKKESTATKKEVPASTEDDPISKLTVSPEHEKLIKDALESAKQGKQVPMDKNYKEVSWGEIEKVLGEPAMSGPEDGGSMTYAAGKYEITFLFKGPDSPKYFQKKLVSMKVEAAEITK